MKIIHVNEIVKRIQPLYDRRLAMELILHLFPKHKYAPFIKTEDVEGIAYITCTDNGWDILNALAIYSDENIIRNRYGSVCTFSDLTDEKFVDIMTRSLKMKVFL
jgi:hypothetical protein